MICSYSHLRNLRQVISITSQSHPSFNLFTPVVSQLYLLGIAGPPPTSRGDNHADPALPSSVKDNSELKLMIVNKKSLILCWEKQLLLFSHKKQNKNSIINDATPYLYIH